MFALSKSLNRKSIALCLSLTAALGTWCTTSHAAERDQAGFSSIGVLPQAPQFYKMEFGGAKITAISDGTIPLNTSKLLLGANSKSMRQHLHNAFVGEDVETSINVFLLEMDGRRILVDTGAGELFSAFNIGGKLFQNLKALGIEPGDITDILITHVHVDHSGGLTIAKNRMFPKAVVHVGKPDVDFFLDPAQAKTSKYRPEALPQAFEQAVQTLGPYVSSGQVQAFEGTKEIMPGLTGTVHPGHTPGSAFYTLTRKGQKMVFIGDTIHVAAVQLPEPQVAIVFDVDPKGAVANRRKAFSEFSRTGVLVAAPHLQYPGIGHIRRAGKGYAWVPVLFNDREQK